jgi:hypothetical protein
MSETTMSSSRATASPEPVPFAIRVLRRLNPLIAGLLRSPLHGLASRDLLLLTYVGAKTGMRRTLPLSYVEVGGRPYLCTAARAGGATSGMAVPWRLVSAAAP